MSEKLACKIPFGGKCDGPLHFHAVCDDARAGGSRGGKTVLENDASLSGGGTTIQEATLFDAAGRTQTGEKENAAIKKGYTILDTYRIEFNAIQGGMGSVWQVCYK